LACTIVAVGKDASSTGHPLVSHTDDSGGSTTDIRFIRVPRKQWPAGSVRPLYDWADGYPRVVSSTLSPEYAPVNGQAETLPIGSIPQVSETFAYWDMDYGVQNEKGLSIGESTCTARTVGWPATPDKPYGYNHAGIEDLSKIALERCATARCAVKTMGDVAVEQGFYSADSGAPEKPDYSDSAEALVVGDADGELWIFNVMTGANNASAIWAAKRVPSDHVVAVGNSFTIRKMRLNETENFLYSPGVTKLAVEKGWWRPEDDAPGVFDFFGAYGYTPEATPGSDAGVTEQLKQTLAYYSGRRMWRIFSLLSPAEGAKLDPNKGNLPSTVDPYPGSVPAPPGSVTPQMVMDVLRDHYEGTPYDLTQGMAAGPFGSPNRGPVPEKGSRGVWERAISMHRSSWSYVLEANPDGRSVSWLGLDSPHGSAYLPFFGAATAGAPESFRSHEGCMSKFSTEVAWWAFNVVNQYSDLNFRAINKDVRAKSKAIETEGVGRVASCMAEADAKTAAAGDARGNGDGTTAWLNAMTTCSNSFAQAKVDEWWAFAWSLFAKFGRYAITYNESANGEAFQIYPSWWLNSPEVGFSTWSPSGPFHGITLASVSTYGRSHGATNVPVPPESTSGSMSLVFSLLGSMSLVFSLLFAAMAAVALIAYKAGVRNGKRNVNAFDYRGASS